MKHILTFLCCLAYCLCLYPTELTFTENTYKNCLYTEICITAYDNKCEVGEIWYVKIPFLPISILYNFYVIPMERSKGIGRALLHYACNRVHSKTNMIFIQPGPFEKTGRLAHALQDEVVYKERLKHLVTSYSHAGFKTAHWSLIYCCRMLYYIVGLKEDANYLMYL